MSRQGLPSSACRLFRAKQIVIDPPLVSVRIAAAMHSPTVKKISPIVYFVGLTAALAGLLFGLDIGVISGAQQFIQSDFHVADWEVESIVSALLWGAVFGTLISGFLSSHFGRRKTILLSAITFAIGSIFCSLASGAGALIGARFILGIAVGVASFTAPLYLSEVSPPRVRGSMISMYQLMITIGIVIAFVSDTWLSSYANFGGMVGGHWRVMLGIIAVPAVVMFVGVLFLPESPRWLFLKGRKSQAVDVLRHLQLAEPEIEIEVREIEQSLQVRQTGLHMFLRNSNFRRAILLGMGLQTIQQLTGINVVMYYAPHIFKIAGFTTTVEQMWGTVVVGVTNVLATFIAIALVDRLGRKPIMYAGFIVMGVAMLTVGYFFKSDIEAHPDLGYPAIFALLMFIIGFAMSAGPIIWILCSEIFPNSGRDFGITFSTSTNWFVNAIVGQTFLTLLNTLGNGNTFLMYGGLNVLFIVFFLFFVPETKGVTLEKIEGNLLSGVPLRKIGQA
jgi:SP family galactose:H+ symporter-like MFS transporter